MTREMEGRRVHLPSVESQDSHKTTVSLDPSKQTLREFSNYF